MRKKTIAKFIFLSILLIGSVLNTHGQPANSLFQYEKFVIRSMRAIHAAQVTYVWDIGNGNYAATFEALRQANLIDAVLASGNKYGYTFAMTVTPRTATTPATFFITATPKRYPKTGRRSFFMDVLGEMRGGDIQGSVATASDPYIDSCALWGINDNERCTMRAMQTLHGAEMTYSSTYGNGNYGTLNQMGATSLIHRTLATGLIHGYSFTVTLIVSSPTVPAQFKISAVPRIYGTTGVRSFFMDTSGVLYGADKHGEPATENDPFIDLCTQGSIADNERCTIYSLWTLHGAEMTYASTFGNGSYTGSLAELASIGLIQTQLGSGGFRGYSFSASAFSQTPTIPPAFKITATPQRYGITGIRSFFVGTDGVVRGADKHGEPADEHDPPITDL